MNDLLTMYELIINNNKHYSIKYYKMIHIFNYI